MSGMLVRPSPLPEELDLGYLGRLMRTNGYHSKNEFVKAMAMHVGMPSRQQRELPVAQLLAMMADQTAEEFAQKHTTQPFRRAITHYYPELMHGSLERLSFAFKSGVKTARDGLYFCPECAKEDVDRHGVSYWRRNIQIPGQVWCASHGAPLFYILAKGGSEQTPLSYLDTAERVSLSLGRAAANNAAVGRYLEVAAGLAERPKPLDVRIASAILKSQARSLGFRTHGGKGSSPLLSDFMVQSFPREWLATICPDLLNKPVGRHLNKVDGVLHLERGASGAWNYLLAAAVLFPTSEAALNSLTEQSEPNRPEPRVKRSSTSAPEDWRILRAYAGSYGDHSNVRHQFKLPRRTAEYHFKKLGLPSLSGANKSGRRQALSALLLEGKSLAESAQLGNMTDSELLALFRECCPNMVSVLQEMANSEAVPQKVGRGMRAVTPGEAEHVGRAEAMAILD